MTALKLRPYQTEAIAAIHAEWESGVNRTAVVLPTGMGKTVVFAHLAAEYVASKKRFGNPVLPGRPLILVHREELITQTVNKLHSVAPHLSVGVVKAERNECDGDVIVASVQTLSRPRRMAELKNVGMIIVDEAHHAAADSYVSIITHFGGINYPDGTPVVGFSATLSRSDDKALGNVWQTVCYEKDILYGIERGYLTDVRGVKVTVDDLDLDTVARSRGDYQEGKLGDALVQSGAGEAIATAYNEHAPGKKGVLFAPTVDSARDLAWHLNQRYIPTEVVTGTTTTEERAEIYDRFENGATQVLASCMVLTEGWDAPHAEVAVIARPTQHAGLYVQMVGRVLRPFPGKACALVLDVVGVSSRLDLASITDLAGHSVRPQEGESLAGAASREAKERTAAGLHLPEGQVQTHDVDLFDRSTSAWLRTKKGIWFIPTKSATYFIHKSRKMIEKDKTVSWFVGRKESGRAGEVLHNGLTRDWAMEHCEQAATEADASISSKDSSWRKKKSKPSDKQIAIMARGRIPITETMTKNEASNLISVMIASNLLDHLTKEG